MAGNISKYIVDASFVLSFLLLDEFNPQVEKAFEQFRLKQVQLTAPFVLPFEVFNGLHASLRSHRVDIDTITELGQKFLSLGINLCEVDYEQVSKLALKQNLSFYDASYVYLAQSEQAKLLTLDKKLQDQ